MRLTDLYTYRNEEGYVCSEAMAKNDDIRSCLEKLYVLEDIEEELGIDLVTLSKVLYALSNSCVYVKIKEEKQYDGYSFYEETGEIRRCVIARFDRYSNGTRNWFFTISFSLDNISSVNHYFLEHYGKTWALTREELL